MIEQVHKYIRRLRLILPGERVAVAVSGGADSVALLRVLVDLRERLGMVVLVAHFNHGIRGGEADADEQFVRDMAATLGLEFCGGAADVPGHARSHKISLETAARALRHEWFGRIVGENKADKIATAHTMDDQAETVLMRILRGTGSRGLAGIFPAQKEKHLIRPFLDRTRQEVEAYLRLIGQSWREDFTNRDLSHTRNRIRHQLLPVLERDFNRAIRQTLADLAEIARAESEYWDSEIDSLLTRMVQTGKPSRSGRTHSREASRTVALELKPFLLLPIAMQRQLLHSIGDRLDVGLEFKHIQQLMELARERVSGKKLLLPSGYWAIRSHRELQFRPAEEEEADYQYVLNVPGEVEVPELGSIIRARVVGVGSKGREEYDPRALLSRAMLAERLSVRNWRAGDKFFPANTRSPRKLKELLQPDRLGQQLSLADRKLWPVVESEGQIVWVRGFATPQALAPREEDGVVIEETRTGVPG